MMRFSPVILFALAARGRPGCGAFEPPVSATTSATARRRREGPTFDCRGPRCLRRGISRPRPVLGWPRTGTTTALASSSPSSPLFPSDDSEYEQSGRATLPAPPEDPFDEAVDRLASALVGPRRSADSGDDGAASPPFEYQLRTVIRVVVPSLLAAAVSTVAYAPAVAALTGMHTSLSGNSPDLYNDQVLTVLSNDLSQYVQNILTTCALLFGMLVGQTYYFMYQQQELVFYALFAEVTEAKSLLEQISLMSYGRQDLYTSLLSRMKDYVEDDLRLLCVKDPVDLTSRLPREDPLESILYATSVGLPGVAYDTVKDLRVARAGRCAALQRKLPALHVHCLRLLGVIVLVTFPVCGSGSQAIAPNVLVLQSYMFGVLAFGLMLVLNVVEELRNSRTKMGAYNVNTVLNVMVRGLEEELYDRLDGKIWSGVSPGLPMAAEELAENSREYPRIGTLEDADVTEQSSLSKRQRMRLWLQRKVARPSTTP
mmetsp:Transcript_23475/g.52364  ORF Transcript_23475/g.52364 Transcript_23475/m.52364 type:complete len:485 (-) Transcript_23475:2-1456(-)